MKIKKSILKTGTTILGIVCKDGVVMAADRRTSLGHGLIFHKDSRKVETINDYLVFAGCGSAVETQKVSKLLVAELKLKELKSKSRPSIKQAANLTSTMAFFKCKTTFYDSKYCSIISWRILMKMVL